MRTEKPLGLAKMTSSDELITNRTGTCESCKQDRYTCKSYHPVLEEVIAIRKFAGNFYENIRSSYILIFKKKNLVN